MNENPASSSADTADHNKDSSSANASSKTESSVNTLVVNLQYIKELSVKIPGAPNIYRNLPKKPYVSFNIDVNAQQLGENEPNFEVTLSILCHSSIAAPNEEDSNPPVLFTIDAYYSAIVTLLDMKNSNIERLLLIETPRLIFPEARNIILNLTKDAGFPPVIMQNIDFENLWHQRRRKAKKSAENQ